MCYPHILLSKHYPILSTHPTINTFTHSQLRWVLDQPAVGGAIVGVRFGLKEHLADNQRVFNLALDDTGIPNDTPSRPIIVIYLY